MNCREVRKVVFLYTDDEMEEGLLISFREHMSLCPPCARRAQITRWLLAEIRRRLYRETAPERLRRRILRSLPHRRA